MSALHSISGGNFVGIAHVPNRTHNIKTGGGGVVYPPSLLTQGSFDATCTKVADFSDKLPGLPFYFMLIAIDHHGSEYVDYCICNPQNLPEAGNNVRFTPKTDTSDKITNPFCVVTGNGPIDDRELS